MLPNIAPMMPPAPPALLHKLRTMAHYDWPASDASTPVPSPCVSVCRMDESRQYCVGCLRTLDELRAWGGSDNAAKRAIWLRVRQRAATTT